MNIRLQKLTSFVATPKVQMALSTIIFMAVVAASLLTSRAAPAVIEPQNQPPAGFNGAKVTFSFDDGFESFLTEAAPVLNRYGFVGTAYITSEYMGSHHDFLDWPQVTELEEMYGWEIGGHSFNHANLEESDSEMIEYEVSENYRSLVERGFDPQTFASPFGAYSGDSIAEVATKYRGHRGFHDVGYNTWPYGDYLLKVQQVQLGVSVETVKGYIDEAIATDTWLILVFHDIADSPRGFPGNSYDYSTADLDAIARYVHEKQLPVTTVSNGLVPDTDNLLRGGSFTGGLTGGWTVDYGPVLADYNGNGSFPEPADSLWIKSAEDRNVHIRSPQISVDSNLAYTISSYVNIVNRQGEIALFIDEYDTAGDWISGQYHPGTIFDDEKGVNISYAPSSNDVAAARVQFIAEAGSGTEAYIDEVVWRVAN